MALLEQMQAKMEQLKQENERFKILFAGDQSDAQPPEHFRTPQKATAAIPQAEIPTPWLGGSVAHTPRSLDVLQIASSPEPTPNSGWQSQPWCQPASEAWNSWASVEGQKQPWCQPASQNQWQGSGWGWTNYSDNGWIDLKESNSYHGYYANGWSDLKEIHHKDLKAPDTYSGDITQWKAWSRAFESYLRRRDTRWPGLLEKVQELKGKPVTEEYEKKWAWELGIYDMAQFKDHLI
jgi:hypothetical protein